MYKKYQSINGVCQTLCKNRKDIILFNSDVCIGSTYCIKDCPYYDGYKNDEEIICAIPDSSFVNNNILTKLHQIIFKHWRGEMDEYAALIKEIDKLFEDGE